MNDDTENERALARREKLGEAIRRYRGDMTQAELGAKVDLPQTTVSRWEGARVDLSLEQVRLLERALGLELGTLAKAAGFVDTAFGDDEDEPTLIRTSYCDSFEDLVVEFLAAEALGLGVRVWNRWVPAREHDGMTMEWGMTLLADAPGDE
jgi:transcriptional regulator with XRE-family HTH domain